jgi:hypothetical protein
MTTDTMSFAGSGMIFNNTFTANVTPAYMNCVLSAEQMIASEFTNSITINLEFDAQALGTNTYGAINRLGPGGGIVVSYSTFKNGLESLASQEPNNSIFQQAVANLPATDPSGGAGFLLSQPYARLLGLSTTSGNPDVIITLNTSLNWSYGPDVISAMEHEISEGGMGRFGGLGDQQGSHWAPMDLFRYNASGVRDYSDGRDGQAAYFSYDGGATLSLSAGLSFNNEYDSAGLKVNTKDVADFNELDVFGHGGTDTLSPTDIAILDALGWNSITANVQNDYLAITRTTLAIDQATTIANAIIAGSQTETQYVIGLLDQVVNTTIPAVAVEASMYGVTGTSAEITSLVVNFLPVQVANAISHNLNPQVYACEALGLVFAFGNETGSTAFASNFGPSNNAMPNTAAGDAAFAAAACTTIFGAASTANLVSVMQNFVSNWEAFYTAHGVPGVANTTAAQIDLAARGAAWGDMVGVALANSLGPLHDQTINFLADAAQGTAIYGASLVGQPAHQPFA